MHGVETTGEKSDPYLILYPQMYSEELEDLNAEKLKLYKFWEKKKGEFQKS